MEIKEVQKKQVETMLFIKDTFTARTRSNEEESNGESVDEGQSDRGDIIEKGEIECDAFRTPATENMRAEQLRLYIQQLFLNDHYQIITQSTISTPQV